MNEPRKTVTLEDLLRLKRAEQPPAEFWAEFDRGLRTKQLAAIVEPRPWWAPFIRISARMVRYQLPVGATAVIAITLFTIREYHPASSVPTFEPTVIEASQPTPAPVAAKVVATEPVSAPAPSPAAMVAAAEPTPAPAATETPAEPAAPAASTAVGASSHLAMVSSEFSSAGYIADKLAAAQATDPALDPMLGRTLRAMENVARSEPLAQINVPGESRHSRLLVGTSWLASASTGDSALRNNEQAARHLTERRLAESDVISRLDVAGNKVRIKF